MSNHKNSSQGSIKSGNALTPQSATQFNKRPNLGEFSSFDTNKDQFKTMFAEMELKIERVEGKVK